MIIIYEFIFLLVVIISARMLIWAIERLLKRKIHNKLVLIVFYFVIFLIYLDANERLIRKEYNNGIKWGQTPGDLK